MQCPGVACDLPTPLYKQPIVIALQHYLCIFLCAAAVLDLESSVGMRQACPDEIVTFTCTLSGSSGIWFVHPRLPEDATSENPVAMTTVLTFTATSELNGSVVECREENGTDFLNNTLIVTGML